MGLPWSTAETPEEDVGHALEGTAFQGVSVFRDPAEHPGSPPRVDPHLCLTRQSTTNPTLGEEPVTGFVVKWAIETTPLVSNSEGTRMRLWRHERTLRVVVSGSHLPLPHYDW